MTTTQAPTPSPELLPSQAILAGAALVRKQITGDFFEIPFNFFKENGYTRDDANKEGRVQTARVPDNTPIRKICACAIGAMAIGWNLQDGDEALSKVDEIAYNKGIALTFPADAQPKNQTGYATPSYVVPILNDEHFWSFERIAKYLADNGL